MSYHIDPHQAMTDLYGVGKGAAQVIDTSATMNRLEHESQRSWEEQQQQKRAKATREANLNKSVMDLGSLDIDPDHQAYFAQKQADFNKFTHQNITALNNGDPNATMEWQKMYSDIKTQANLSKNFREKREQYGNELVKDPDAYRPEAIDYFHKAALNSDGTPNYKFDPANLKKDTNLVNDFRTNVRPLMEDIAKGKSYSYEDADGNQHTIDYDHLDEKAATTLLQDRLKDPHIAEQASYDFNKLSDNEQRMYDNDFSKYYVQKLLPYSIINRDKTVDKAGADTEKAKIEYADAENPMSIKTETKIHTPELNDAQKAIVNLTPEQVATLTPEQKSTRDDLISGQVTGVHDIPMLAKATHMKPIKVATATTGGMRTLNGGKIPKGVEVHDAEYGQTAPMPFVKSGPNKGDVVTNQNMAEMEKAGNVEWKVASTGVIKYGEGVKAKEVSIVRPTSEIKSPIAKHVDLPALQKIADEKNAQYKQEPKQLSGKINPKDLQVGNSYIVNGANYTWNGTKLVKK